ncbi:MAG: DoxX family membrane protein [Desulfobacteraceae bacterium]|nr:DoxX family membrane protein [Desulfobacteraceae bacterium]
MKKDRKQLLAMVLRIMLGMTFIVASAGKIGEPGKFATIIYGYYLFPGWIINFSAIILPFVELVAGVALVAGVYPRSALMILNGLLLAFIVAISINLVRGHQFDCGCFSLAASDSVESAAWLLVRDLGLLACGAYLWFASSPRMPRRPF